MEINPNDKYVLISGCNIDFNHGLTIELDKQDFNVLTDISDPNNQDTLSQLLLSRAIVFKLDITHQEDIDVAHVMISTKTETLHALVHNAGIGYSGFIDWITVESMCKMLDGNFFGHVKILRVKVSKAAATMRM